MRGTNARIAAVTSAVLALAVVLVACVVDPVHQRDIDHVGAETGEQNELHRPGQRCVACHSPGGGATAFAIAGTIFKNRTGPSVGAAGVWVTLRGSDGVVRPLKTNAAGNFYWPREFWDIVYPVEVVSIDVENDGGPPAPTMATHIGRERSCAACHFDADPANPDDVRKAVGHIYMSRQ